MVLNTPLSHNLSIYYYNKDVYKDQSDYRSIRRELLEILQQAWGLQLY